LETAEALRQSGSLRVARIAKKKARKMRALFLKRRYLLVLHQVLIFLKCIPLVDHIPDLPPPEEFALEPAPAVLFAGAAPPEADLPLPPLNPVGLEPLLDPVVPLPGLRPVGFDPLLEPVPVAGLALPAGGTLPGTMPGVT
jgi:hypothetical protein